MGQPGVTLRRRQPSLPPWHLFLCLTARRTPALQTRVCEPVLKRTGALASAEESTSQLCQDGRHDLGKLPALFTFPLPCL